ncbi:endolytic transglycosylase MltG [Pseudarthrobacter sp. AL07]|uniref:endolytic transglycosylase MltG n=1 Tax=unclassified Pseudarthrobacter TaxID=2647000 RepID=UPI00249C4EEE|nr:MULTISPECIES: endolytic transglycosylase MltG [unclassified Pseudarthrobacter]MDI3194957.1 endolytic transglycosylase MltG [Pseudarthrobacter sp. AL20]MDI3208986.1 endolytic transglycosylase MltG [Pseudarthrobacter sp. AL07]
MSPSNNDDPSGATSNHGARPLTRKELRALEKHTGGNDVVPEQAYETGQDAPAPATASSPEAAPAPEPAPLREPAPEPQPEPVHAPETELQPIIPTAPDEPPSIQNAVPIADHHPDDAQVQEYHPEDQHHYEAHDAGHHYPDEEHHYAGHFDDHHVDDHHPDDHSAGSGLFAGAAAGSVVAKPSKKVRRRRRLLALFLTLVVFVAAIAVGAQFLKPLLGNDKAAGYPGPGTGEVMVSVQPGEGTRSVATKLESGKVVANADTFLQAFASSGGTLSPGDYKFKMEMKNSDAVSVLLGTDKSKVIYFALSAGLRVGESLQAISEGSGVSVLQLKQLSDSPQQFGLPANAKNLEGYLAPGEHRFPLGTPAKDILQSLVKVTTDELVAQGITDPAKQYEAVIVASIVQAEGGQAEYGDVAGAIYNRLKPNDQTSGFLQVDSAVTYGLGTKSFNFTDAERKDKSNLYNTYANPGLPPGPIGSPGKTAIDAAARPKANDYLYWVTINLDTKETKFSKTLDEHNRYVSQYNAWCQANVGRCA